MARYLVGLDLGQAGDPSALAVLKRSEAPVDEPDHRGRKLYCYDVVHLARYPLGTPYPAVVRDVAGLVNRRELARECRLTTLWPLKSIDKTSARKK